MRLPLFISLLIIEKVGLSATGPFLEIRQKLRVFERSRMWSVWCPVAASDVPALWENWEYLGRHSFCISRPPHFCQSLAMPLKFVLSVSFNLLDTKKQIFFCFLSNIITHMILPTIYFSLFNQIGSYLYPKQTENIHHNHIHFQFNCNKVK